MPTLSQENYLKALWHLTAGGKVSLQRLASHLGISPASTLAMVRKLASDKLVTYNRAAGIRLTVKGQAAATQIVRRHRLWEVFLHDKLGYRWDEVHDIAEQLEHVAPADLTERLDAFLGHPTFDPHGDPIPQRDGTIPQRTELVLSEQPPGSYRIVGLAETRDELLRQLTSLHLTIGQVLELRDHRRFDDVFVLRVGSRTEHVGRAVADRILVEPA
ncbi:MAG: metal-dependent transcriptional regulator [Chlorobi bacterium]|nr:metal-dependent transcriptional regulator [Chlorobiota bacterium]